MDNTNQTANDIHHLAEKAREEKRFVEALVLSDEALIKYVEEGNVVGSAEIQASRSITFRLLSQETENFVYLILAKFAAMASVEISRGLADKSALALPLLNLGKVQVALKQLTDAVSSFEEVVEIMKNTPPAWHNRPGVLADIEIHLHGAELQAGDLSAKERLLSAIRDLESSDEDGYNKAVWVSGGYMRLAEGLAPSDPTAAKEYLQKAKEVIDGDRRLVIRKQQWTKLSNALHLS
ncbi:MAG: hypothetical protein UZ21_OP11001000219 [Microgenomates bacterium OLB22]|nr:MAG: hypothetical protein UZ21_OP11001000219 [Microgenomates bacterium OLB22]